MPAIITNKFRFENAKAFIDSATADNLYLFLGKSDAWSSTLGNAVDSAAVTPADTIIEENDARQNMISGKRIGQSDISFVTRRGLARTWSSGSQYDAWDDSDEDIFDKNFYVVQTDDYYIYKCVRAGTGNSINKPTHTGIDPVKYADGYWWKFMQEIDTPEADKFLTNNYMPLVTVTSDPGAPGTAQDRWDRQQQALTTNPGRIYRYIVKSPGSNYTNPTVTVKGNGTGAAVTVTLGTGGTIAAVEVAGIAGLTPSFGSGYTNAFVTITDATGSGAVIHPVLTPLGNHGADPVRELGGFYIAARVQLTGTEGGTDFIVNNAFRQLGIIKNPLAYSSSSEITATSFNALRKLNVTSNSLIVGGYMVGQTSGATAYIDDITIPVSGPVVVKYHQNDKTGYLSFSPGGENITGYTAGGASGGSAVIPPTGGFSNPDINRFSGQILFLENRAKIDRAAEQVEEIKIIVQF